MDDNWYFDVSAEYWYNSDLMLTAGFSYDTSLSDAGRRLVNMPPCDIYRWGIGFKYRKNDAVTLGACLIPINKDLIDRLH